MAGTIKLFFPLKLTIIEQKKHKEMDDKCPADFARKLIFPALNVNYRDDETTLPLLRNMLFMKHF